MGSIAQQMAMKNWFFNFQSADHVFLVHCNIFANVSTVLANVEEPEVVKKKESSKDGKVIEQRGCLSGNGRGEGQGGERGRRGEGWERGRRGEGKGG